MANCAILIRSTVCAKHLVGVFKAGLIRRIRISDEGGGISRNDLAKIWKFMYTTSRALDQSRCLSFIPCSFIAFWLDLWTLAFWLQRGQQQPSFLHERCCDWRLMHVFKYEADSNKCPAFAFSSILSEMAQQIEVLFGIMFKPRSSATTKDATGVQRLGLVLGLGPWPIFGTG